MLVCGKNKKKIQQTSNLIRLVAIFDCYILGFITLLNIWAIVFSLNHLQCILHYYSLLWKQWFIWNQTFYKCSVCGPMQVYVFVMLTLKSKGPVRHPKNIIWTEASEVHIIFFWWRTGPYTAIWPEVTWTICYIILFI
jgi:hypothetical protein